MTRKKSKRNTTPPSTPEPFPATEPNAGGRPPIYQQAFVKVAEQLCRLGATDHELAQAFEVAESTIRRWRCEHADFGLACRVAKSEADDRVEASLYARAVGYSFAAEKIFCTKEGYVVRADYTEHVPPDVTAAFKWLINRRPEKWRDKLEIGDAKPLDVSSEPLSPDEWRAQYSKPS